MASLSAAVHEALAACEYETAAFLCEQLLAGTSGDREGVTVLLGTIYLRQGKFRRAWRALERCVSHAGRYLLAQACFHLEKHYEAEVALIGPRSAHPPSPGALAGGTLLEGVRDEDMPNGAYGFVLLGRVCERTARTDMAIEAYRRAVRGAPFMWAAYRALCDLGVRDVPPESLFEGHTPPTMAEGGGGAEVAAASALTPAAASTAAQPPQRPPRRRAGASQRAAPPSAGPSPTVPFLVQMSPLTPAVRARGGGFGGRGGGGAGATTTPAALSMSTPAAPSAAPAERTPGAGGGGGGGGAPTAPRRRRAPATPRRSARLRSDDDEGQEQEQQQQQQQQQQQPPASRRGDGARGEEDRGNKQPMAPPQAPAKRKKRGASSSSSSSSSSSFSSMAPPPPRTPLDMPPPATPLRFRVDSLLGTATPAPASSGARDWTAACQLVGRLGRAYRLLTAFQCSRALDELRALPAEHFETGWVQAHVGRCHFEMVDYTRAAEAFERMRKVSPDRTAGLDLYSTALWHLKEEVRLAYLAQHATETDPLCAETWVVVGNNFSLQKEPETALRFFRRASQLDKHYAYAHTLCAHEYVAIEDFDKAVAGYRRAVGADARHYNAWFGLGNIYYRQEKYELAVYHFRRAISINPSSSVLWCYLGMVLHASARPQAALRVLQRAEDLEPANPLAKYQKAEVYFASGMLGEALDELRQVLEHAPREASVHFLLGRVLRGLGRTSDAAMHFSTALDLDPKDRNVVKAAIESLRAEEPAGGGADVASSP